MNNHYCEIFGYDVDRIIDITKPGFYGEDLEDAVESCECLEDYSVGILVPDASDIRSVLDELYDLVKDSAYTVSEFVSAKPNRISFITGSYIDVKNVNNKRGEANG